ncbi:MAG: serine hydroxymethyltransferase [Patescibacteria group bacterium]
MKVRDKEIEDLILKEDKRQENVIELIASENYVSKDVREAQGSVLTNKYAEGYPGSRYYGGCTVVDEIENMAISRAKDLFKVSFVNVQPNSGSGANLAVYFALLRPKDKILGMRLKDGGHLTHGSSVNFSGKLFDFSFYGVTSSGYIDYDEVLKIAQDVKPKMIVCGASSYSRAIDFAKFRDIANSVNAYLFADISHIAGLVVAGLHQSPVDYADIISTTTHKTLRGPRSAILMTNKESVFNLIQKSVFPGFQGGPMIHTIASKAIAFKEASLPSFLRYQEQVLLNSKYMVDAMLKRGFKIVSNGTDNHMFVVDLSNFNITGNEAQDLLDSVNIAVSKSTIPRDSKGPNISSGIRIGTPAVTSRSMREREMEKIAEFITDSIKNRGDIKTLGRIKDSVIKLTKEFPILDYYE